MPLFRQPLSLRASGEAPITSSWSISRWKGGSDPKGSIRRIVGRIVGHIARHVSAGSAARWHAAVGSAITTLANTPERCPLAEEWGGKVIPAYWVPGGKERVSARDYWKQLAISLFWCEAGRGIG